MPTTDVPVSTYQRIDTGTTAKNNFPSPPRKSVIKLNVFSIFLSLVNNK